MNYLGNTVREIIIEFLLDTLCFIVMEIIGIAMAYPIGMTFMVILANIFYSSCGILIGIFGGEPHIWRYEKLGRKYTYEGISTIDFDRKWWRVFLVHCICWIILICFVIYEILKCLLRIPISARRWLTIYKFVVEIIMQLFVFIIVEIVGMLGTIPVMFFLYHMRLIVAFYAHGMCLAICLPLTDAFDFKASNLSNETTNSKESDVLSFNNSDNINIRCGMCYGRNYTTPDMLSTVGYAELVTVGRWVGVAIFSWFVCYWFKRIFIDR